MKNISKIVGMLLLGLVVVMVAMAFLNICPPQGPWPQPPWCSGSTFPWPFSNPNVMTEMDDESGVLIGNDSESTDEDDQNGEESDLQFDSSVSENERLAQVAIGLMQDLSTVNSYFNDAASSITAVNPGGAESASGSSGAASNTSGTDSDLGSGQIPEGFMDPLPETGYIPAPEGACAVGATPSATFLNQKGEKITPELLAEKNIQVINFNELTGGSVEGRALESTITSLITPGDQALGTSAGWNEKVWSQMSQYHTPAESLLDYHLWTVSGEIESVVVDSMSTTLERMGLPGQVINAFNTSQTSGWYADSTPEEADKIAAMEIEAIFSGRTEGTIFETRDFSLPNLGEMPQFGPMDGNGSVVYHDPEFGDFPFDLDIEWTKWDDLGRVTEGTIVFSDEKNDIVIEMTVNEDNSRIAFVFREGIKVGVIQVATDGMITYEDLTE